MKPFLDSLNSKVQFALLPKRSIHDNIMIMQEIIHSMYDFKDKNPYVLIHHLEKAYERLSWDTI